MLEHHQKKEKCAGIYHGSIRTLYDHTLSIHIPKDALIFLGDFGKPVGVTIFFWDYSSSQFIANMNLSYQFESSRNITAATICSATKCAIRTLEKKYPLDKSWSIADYIDRSSRYFECSGVAYTFAVIYMDRYSTCSGLCIEGLCSRRLWLVCLMTAVKFLEDVHFKNSYYAKVAGMDLTELNQLEIHLLKSLQFILHVEPEVLRDYESRLYLHSKQCPECSSCSKPSSKKRKNIEEDQSALTEVR